MRPATKPPAPPSTTTSLEDEPRQIAILGEIADVVLNVGGVDRDGGAGGLIRGGEAHLLEQALQDRVQTPGADILDRTVDLLGKAGDLLDRLGEEIELNPFGLQQRLVLSDEARLRLSQNTAQIGAVEAFQLDPDWEPALQLG